MTQSKQRNVMKKFKEKGPKLLIATTVAEEGILCVLLCSIN